MLLLLLLLQTAASAWWSRGAEHTPTVWPTSRTAIGSPGCQSKSSAEKNVEILSMLGTILVCSGEIRTL